MQIQENITLLEDILSEYKDIIGDEYLGYRNHVYRMVHFCFALHYCNDEQREKIIIAGAFHDIGIWINDTVDYISPSIPPAMQYLQKRNLMTWSDEIELMITEHHKIRSYQDQRYPLVEVFRKADLIDFSLGLFKYGLTKDFIDQMKTTFPNADFHKKLSKRWTKWFLKHPLNPVPMMKW